MKKTLMNFLNGMPYIRSLHRDLNRYKTKYAPGHFYSPVPSVAEVLQQEARIFSVPRSLGGIDLNEKEQLDLLERFRPYYAAFPFGEEKKENLRYTLNNENYFDSDAVFLYSVIRHFQPRSIIEVGSGYSSALMLDTNDLFFQGKISLTFIEPYADRLKAQLKPRDGSNTSLIEGQLQQVDISLFTQLKAGDVLFIDSTHVAKAGSDVNYIFFDILPVLKPGVLIHFHDIFYPFEYPKEWIVRGRAWNENYLLRAFLQYNHQFRIIAFNTFLERYHSAWFAVHMPLCLRKRVNAVTGSIWLIKE